MSKYQAQNIVDSDSLSSTNVVDVINPATEQSVGQVHFATTEIFQQAVESSKNAFKSWSETPINDRKQALLKLHGLMEKHFEELAKLSTLESGKPLTGYNEIGSRMEVGGAMAWLEYAANLELSVKTIQDNEEKQIEVHHKPLGVVASITPWNWPLMIAAWHIFAPLMAGNTVIIKPSPNTPMATHKMVELANQILPKGVLNLVHGETEIGAAISENEHINKIVFTGSTPTGKAVMRSSATTLKRLVLELGGNDAGILLPGTDIQKRIGDIFQACIHNNGQTCAALKRLYVHDSQYEEVVAAMVEIAGSIKVGDGLLEETDLGPLQNAKQLKIIEDFVADAKQKGGVVVCGGERVGSSGYFYRPTVIRNVSDGVRLVDEEQFGPVIPIIRYENIDEVIARANQNECGLGGSIWGEDKDLLRSLALKIESGTCWINEHGAVQPDAPFGGVKNSGIGIEFGEDWLEDFSSVQTIHYNKA